MQQKLTQIQEMWSSPAHLLFVQKTDLKPGNLLLFLTRNVPIHLIYNIPNG